MYISRHIISKRLTFLLVVALAFLIGYACPVYSQNIEGQLIASQYGSWRIQGYAPDTYTFAPTSCRVKGGASFFNAFTVGTPVLIVDGNPALSEVVTPTNVVINNNTCAISISPVNHHNLPFYLTSATGGLQESINANLMAPGSNTILLGNPWYALGGSTGIIAVAKGTVELGLIDITTTPSTWYHWNGTQYVANQFGSVFSVFGRDGNVVAVTGDYTCAQVTGCQSVVVTSFNSRSGVVLPTTGDYTCSMVTGCPTGTIVTSFNGRTGTVVPTLGDYTCFMVTNCGLAPVSGWTGTLTASQTSSATTASIETASDDVPPSSGYFLVDSEWEYFTSVTSLGGSDYTLSGITRGEYATTAASHSDSAITTGQLWSGSPTTAANFINVVGDATDGYSLRFNCPTTGYAGNTVEFDCGSDQLTINSNGSVTALSSSASFFKAGFSAGYQGSGFANPAITSSVNVVQNSSPNEMFQPLGLSQGIAGDVEATVPGTIGAPTLTNNFAGSGSCSITYEVTGIDTDGNTIAGTTATINSLATPPFTGGNVGIQGVQYAGAVTFKVYRTAVSGCGSLALGSFTSTVTNTPFPFFEDGGTGGDSTSPPSTTSIPKVCTNGTQFCMLSGTSSTPPVACGASTYGWLYTNVAATTSPFAYKCPSGASAWVTAY